MFKRIPILMYHTIEPEDSGRIYEEEKFYNVTPEKFRGQMAYLKENGYSAVTVEELYRIENREELPGRPVMLTFDDGHISHYDTVLPILKELGFTGVFFLVTGDIGKEHRINWNQVREMDKSGMDIGSHGVNHEIINKFPYQNLIIELRASKEELEENIGKEVMAFSIPRGFYSPKISDVARGMGYKLVFTSFAGSISLFSNPYRLRRMVMIGKYSMKEFISVVRRNPRFLLRKRIIQSGKTVLQKVVGLRRYERIKKAVFARG